LAQKVADETPEWIQIGDFTRSGMLPMDAWDTLDEMMEERARKEDAGRRKSAGLA
jgi:hypothetical protein